MLSSPKKTRAVPLSVPGELLSIDKATRGKILKHERIVREVYLSDSGGRMAISFSAAWSRVSRKVYKRIWAENTLNEEKYIITGFSGMFPVLSVLHSAHFMPPALRAVSADWLKAFTRVTTVKLWMLIKADMIQTSAHYGKGYFILSVKGLALMNLIFEQAEADFNAFISGQKELLNK